MSENNDKKTSICDVKDSLLISIKYGTTNISANATAYKMLCDAELSELQLELMRKSSEPFNGSESRLSLEYIQERISQAVAEEREECAKIAEYWYSGNNGDSAGQVARDIRARTQNDCKS